MSADLDMTEDTEESIEEEASNRDDVLTCTPRTFDLVCVNAIRSI